MAKKSTLIYLEEELKKKVQRYCLEENKSLTGLIEELLESYMDICERFPNNKK